MPGSPLIPKVNFGNKRNSYKALIDSGSDISILSFSVFKKINKKCVLSCTKSNMVPLTSASGHTITPIARVQVRMFISNLPCVVTFVLVHEL